MKTTKKTTTTTTTRTRSAIVTGAGRGLGRDIAGLLADRGYRVMIIDLDEQTARAAAAEIGRGALWAVVDVRDSEQVGQARDRLVAETGGVDLWVNNAGVLLTGLAWEQSDDQRRLMLDVNALGSINGTVAAIEAMRGHGTGSPGGGGHIVNIVSLAGIAPVPGEAVYAASKHAVMGFSSSTAADLRLAGVRDIHISCICPDGIWTPMLFDKLEDPQAALSFSGVLLQPADVVRAVGKVLESPRPVTAVPARRGALARLGAVFPRLGTAVLPLMAARGRRKQRSLLRTRGASRP